MNKPTVGSYAGSGPKSGQIPPHQKPPVAKSGGGTSTSIKKS